MTLSTPALISDPTPSSNAIPSAVDGTAKKQLSDAQREYKRKKNKNQRNKKKAIHDANVSEARQVKKDLGIKLPPRNDQIITPSLATMLDIETGVHLAVGTRARVRPNRRLANNTKFMKTVITNEAINALKGTPDELHVLNDKIGYVMDEGIEMYLGQHYYAFAPVGVTDHGPTNDAEALLSFFQAAAKSMNPLKSFNHNLSCGEMHGVGFRAGMDTGRSAGAYAFRPSGDSPRIFAEEVYPNLSKIAELYTKYWSEVSIESRDRALEWMHVHHIPSIDVDNYTADTTAPTPVPNLTITHGGFANEAHQDEDVSDYTVGIWLPTINGKLIRPNTREEGTVLRGASWLDGSICFPTLGWTVPTGCRPGMTVLIWRGQHDMHGTIQPDFSKLPPGYDLWGSSVQISRKFYNALGSAWNRPGKPPGTLDPSRVVGQAERLEAAQKAYLG